VYACLDEDDQGTKYETVGVVHGDLKPENILIFPAANGQLVPRITDFGYSFISIGEDDLVLLPESGIWAAPECEGRGCLLQDAKKIDWYSFGLLCIFVLFSDAFDSFGTQEKSIRAVWSALLNDASKEVCQEFQFCKIRGTISEMAVELVHSQQGLSDAERAGLCDLLRKTLSLEKTHRDLGIINFRILVPGDKYVTDLFFQ
jgi:serine/threonine protein kinase